MSVFYNIYNNILEHPNKFVVKKGETINGVATLKSEISCVCDSLESARAGIPTMLEAYDVFDATLETWW